MVERGGTWRCWCVRSSLRAPPIGMNQIDQMAFSRIHSDKYKKPSIPYRVVMVETPFPLHVICVALAGSGGLEWVKPNCSPPWPLTLQFPSRVSWTFSNGYTTCSDQLSCANFHGSACMYRRDGYRIPCLKYVVMTASLGHVILFPILQRKVRTPPMAMRRACILRPWAICAIPSGSRGKLHSRTCTSYLREAVTTTSAGSSSWAGCCFHVGAYPAQLG